MTKRSANFAASGDAPIASLFQVGRRRRRATEQRHLPPHDIHSITCRGSRHSNCAVARSYRSRSRCHASRTGFPVRVYHWLWRSFAFGSLLGWQRAFASSGCCYPVLSPGRLDVRSLGPRVGSLPTFGQSAVGLDSSLDYHRDIFCRHRRFVFATYQVFTK